MTDLISLLIDELVALGLGTLTGKLIFAMVFLIAIVLICSIYRLPVIVMIAMIFVIFVIFIAMDFIPIWIILIFGSVLLLLLLKPLLSGGGSD